MCTIDINRAGTLAASTAARITSSESSNGRPVNRASSGSRTAAPVTCGMHHTIHMPICG